MIRKFLFATASCCAMVLAGCATSDVRVPDSAFTPSGAAAILSKVKTIQDVQAIYGKQDARKYDKFDRGMVVYSWYREAERPSLTCAICISSARKELKVWFDKKDNYVKHDVVGVTYTSGKLASMVFRPRSMTEAELESTMVPPNAGEDILKVKAYYDSLQNPSVAK